ncbi:MAG TPA: alpha/beta hydrolase [Propionibacteriaceae bacterium]|nr:alpha/beta hydrolase [Propionibacteriaceae bacterium]
MTTWHPDFLEGYQSTDLPLTEAERALGEPADTELVATLVRREPADQHRKAVLYVHGWNDYFFQTHLADVWDAAGFDFYALDLRRYGRSKRPGQFHGYITNLDDYGVELLAAADVIGKNHDRLTLMGHSTGGLILALWAAREPERINGLVLNSPWLDLQGSAMVRAIGAPVIDRLGNTLPTAVLRLPDSGFYARALHAAYGGEWHYDLDLKVTPSPPVRVGWLRAVLLGHQRVAAGLRLPMPALVMAAGLTDFRRRWHEDLRYADTVLDVEQIAQRAVRLGRHVTMVRFDRGIHDLVLSEAPVRQQVFGEITRWLAAYVK